MIRSPTQLSFPQWRGTEPYTERARAVTATLRRDWPGLAALGEQLSFARWEATQAAQPAMLGYTYLSPALRAMINAVPAELAPAYFRALLLWHIDRLAERLPVSGLHPEFALQIADSVHRILDQIETEDYEADPRSDLYMKDLGIVRLTMIPAVGQVIYPWRGVPKKKVVEAGLGALWHVWGRCGEAAPFLEIHTHNPMVADYFNPQGWEECYRLTALLFRTYPRARGLLGSSWFYDPKLPALSPRLAYLQEGPLAKGARIIPVGSSEATTASAIAKSETRRRLYNEGRYKPISAMLVWPKSDILRHYK